MLGKLIKYEFKATYKFMVMLYCILFALSLVLSVSLKLNIVDIINGFTSEFNIGGLLMMVISIIFMIMFAVISASVLCGMFFYSIVRFKNNLLGNEGYLMHTLPVKESQNILAKLIVSVVWTIAGVFALIISYGTIILIISSSKAVADLFSQVPALLRTALTYYHDIIPEFILYVVEITLCCLTSLVSMYMHIYASMAVGYSFNSHRALISVGIYIAVSVAMNVIDVIAITPFQYLGIVDTSAVISHFPLIFSSVINLVSAVVLYIVTDYFMSKRLNLQ